MSNTKQEIQTIPIYFNNPSNKGYLIGKVRLNSNNNSYKLMPTASNNEGLGEFSLVNKEKQYLQYKGREAVQDSNYILMKYNSKDKAIHMYPANNWVNFFNAPIKPSKTKVDEKEKRKEKNKILKSLFNLDNEYIVEDTKKGKKKKKSLMANNEEEDFEEPKKKIQTFKEDSHSSENEELGYDSSFEKEEEEKRKKEEEKKKEEKKKTKKDEEEEEEEEEESEEKENSNEDNDEENIDFMNNYSDLIGKKRERENNPSYEMEEKLEIILRKHNKMTEEEIITEIKKVCKNEDIEKYFEKVLNKITGSFTEDNKKTYYYLKK